MNPERRLLLSSLLLAAPILALAHPANNDPANLAALCPRCHLRHNRRQRIPSAYYNQRQRRTVRDLLD